MSEDALREDYARVFAGHLDPGENPGLLLVDMVEAYLRPDSPFFCKDAADAAQKAARLLEGARRAARFVAFTQVEYQPGGADGGLFYRKVPALKAFDAGSPLGRIAQPLTPREGELVVTKQYPSAFFGTGIERALREAEVDSLIIAGFSTSGCVRASALDAMQYGFAPFVVADACADRHHAPHEAALFDLGAKYGEVVDTELALALLEGQTPA